MNGRRDPMNEVFAALRADLDRGAAADSPIVDQMVQVIHESRDQAFGRHRRARASLVAAVVAAAVTMSLAAAGALPDPGQRVAARVLGAVGIHVPEPDVSAPDPSDAVSTTGSGGDSKSNGNPASGSSGAAVRDASGARSTPTVGGSDASSAAAPTPAAKGKGSNATSPANGTGVEAAPAKGGETVRADPPEHTPPGSAPGNAYGDGNGNAYGDGNGDGHAYGDGGGNGNGNGSGETDSPDQSDEVPGREKKNASQ